MEILDSKAVSKRTGLSKTTLWRLEKAGKFPKRLNTSVSRIGWIEAEVDEWIESRPRGICGREIGKGVEV